MRGGLLQQDQKWAKKLWHPIDGIVLSVNVNVVRWAMEESIPADDENCDLFDLVTFRDSFCVKGDAIEGKSQCSACLLSKPAFLRRCRSCFEMRDKPLHPKANDRFLRTMALQSDKIWIRTDSRDIPILSGVVFDTAVTNHS